MSATPPAADRARVGGEHPVPPASRPSDAVRGEAARSPAGLLPFRRVGVGRAQGPGCGPWGRWAGWLGWSTDLRFDGVQQGGYGVAGLARGVFRVVDVRAEPFEQGGGHPLPGPLQQLAAGGRERGLDGAPVPRAAGPLDQAAPLQLLEDDGDAAAG